MWTALAKFIKGNQGIHTVDLGNGNISYYKDLIQACNEPVNLICRFPNLEILNWFYLDRTSCTEEFCSNDLVINIAENCTRIKELTLSSLVRMSLTVPNNQHNIHDYTLSPYLDLSQSASICLEKINFANSRFGPICLQEP
ncbi:hypothetical protein BG003_011152 [Podila horticola]|nr:hypothetical protein BG003_011152 [Podila horticola]